METMYFHLAHSFFRTTSFCIQVVPMSNLAPMKNCPGVQGNLIWLRTIQLQPKMNASIDVTCA